MSFIQRNDLHGLRNFLNSLLGRSFHLTHTHTNTQKTHREFQIPNKTTHKTKPSHTTQTTTFNRFTPLLNQPSTSHTPRVVFDPKLPKLNIQGANHPLSNFHPCRMTFNNQQHKSAEHAYQYTKATFCANHYAASAILQAPNAYVAKHIGNQIKQQCTPHTLKQWDHKKLEVMRDLLNQKFNQSKNFKDALLASGAQRLTHDLIDPFWGSSFSSRKHGHLIQQDWFAKVLMEVRARHIPRIQRTTKPTEGATSQQPRATQGTAKPPRQQTQGKSPTTKDTSESRQGIPAPHPDPPAPTRVEATPQTGTSRDNSSKATKPTTQKTTPAKKPGFHAPLYMKPAAKTTEATTSINSDQDTTQATRGIPNSSQAPPAHTTPQPGPSGAPTIPTSPLPQGTPKPDRQRHSSLQMTPTTTSSPHHQTTP